MHTRRLSKIIHSAFCPTKQASSPFSSLKNDEQQENARAPTDWSPANFSVNNRIRNRREIEWPAIYTGALCLCRRHLIYHRIGCVSKSRIKMKFLIAILLAFAIQSIAVSQGDPRQLRFNYPDTTIENGYVTVSMYFPEKKEAAYIEYQQGQASCFDANLTFEGLVRAVKIAADFPGVIRIFEGDGRLFAVFDTQSQLASFDLYTIYGLYESTDK